MEKKFTPGPLELRYVSGICIGIGTVPKKGISIMTENYKHPEKLTKGKEV